jgi:hypothetical protein
MVKLGRTWTRIEMSFFTTCPVLHNIDMFQLVLAMFSSPLPENPPMELE